MNIKVTAAAAVAAVLLIGGASGAARVSGAAAASTGLVAAYSFDATSGTTAADASGNNNNATLSGVTWSPRGGKYAGAAVLNGTSSLISVPQSTRLDLAQMTIEAWVRPTGSLSGSRTIIAKERTGGGFPYGLEANGGLPGTYATAGSTFARADASASLALKTWRFVAATYDGVTLRLYVGGTQVASKAATGTIVASTGPLRLGGNAVWGEYFKGSIDNVRVYSRALAASELQTDMNTAVKATAAPAPDTQAPSTPAGLSVGGVTASAITLGWSSATDNVGVTGYRLYQDGVAVRTTTSTSSTFSGLSCWTVPGTGLYKLGVAAFDAAGNSSPIASVSQQTLQCPPLGDTQPPSTPAGLVASGVTQTAITLGWTGSTDNVGVTGYRAYLNGAQAGSSSATSYAFSGLTCGTTYNLGVQAYDAAGNSSAQATLSATTAACSASPPPPPPPSGTANVWIDKNGGSCTRQASAAAWVDAQGCGSFKAALAAAQPGDTVLVVCSNGTTGCTYSPETLSGDRGASARVTVAAAPGNTVAFEETAGSGTYVWLSNLHHVTFQNIGFGRNNGGSSSPNLRIDCTRDVTLVNASGRRFYMFEGNANVTFQGGDWGGYSSAGEEDSTMGTTGAYGPAETCPGDSGPRPQSTILFDGVTWHDVFWISSLSSCSGTGQCSQWGGSHPDCFEINGYVDGVTVQNSTFYHCGNTMLSLFTDQGDIKNVVVQNNVFRDMAPSSYYGIQWVRTANFKCDGDKFINNTYTPNVAGGWFVNTPPRFGCATTSSSTGVVVSGNTIQQAPPSTDCTASKGSPNYTVWQNNTFQSGSC